MTPAVKDRFLTTAVREAYTVTSQDLGHIFQDLENGKYYRAIQEGAGSSKWDAQTGDESNLSNVSEDTSPELGGNLDVVTYSIVSSSNRDINITPHGNGECVITDLKLATAMDVNDQVITTTVTNGAITLTPDGTGGVVLKAFATMKARVTLTDAATIATNAALGNMFRVVLTDNRTLGAPTNLVAGGWYQWEIVQDGTGSRTLALASAFHVVGGAYTPSAGANAVDVLYGYYNGTNVMIIVVAKDVKVIP